jgi:hypothetical protein
MTSLTVFDARSCEAAIAMYINTPSTKDCKFFIEGVNDTFLNNNKVESKSDIVIVKFLEDNNWGNFTSFPDRIKNLTSIKDILKLAENCFSKKQTLFNRLVQLINFFYDEEDGGEVSIESLKSMLVFFSSIKSNFNIPSMTLNEDGTFQVNWRKNNLNLITLKFRNENFVDYLIFESSQYTEKPIVSNGNMNLFDFIDRIKSLNLAYLIENKLND